MTALMEVGADAADLPLGHGGASWRARRERIGRRDVALRRRRRRHRCPLRTTKPLPILITPILVELNVVTFFSIAACNGLRAPSWSNCSKNGFSSSSARLPSEITLLLALAHPFFWRPRVTPPGFFIDY